ncbi:MAG TPA: YigZ family protein, partial [Lentimicrobium sp.]|nr:YigZ family protein [Lentimicrobium sp.]
VKVYLEELKKEYFDARHHCYAYILGYDKSAWRLNDDGEPSGTAGKPIYGQLQSFDLTNTLIVVVRYFGGIKLGVSGLINAYRSAAKDALEKAIIIENTINEIYRMEFPYTMINDAMKLIKENDGQIIKTDFDSAAFIIYKIRRNNTSKLKSKCDTLYQIRLIYMGTE